MFEVVPRTARAVDRGPSVHGGETRSVTQSEAGPAELAPGPDLAAASWTPTRHAPSPPTTRSSTAAHLAAVDAVTWHQPSATIDRGTLQSKHQLPGEQGVPR